MTASRKKRLRIAAALLFLLGLGLVCYPVLSNWARNTLQSIDSQRYGSEQSQPNPSADASLEELYRQMQAYNKRLYSEGQKLTDPFAYEQPSFDLKQFGLPDNIVGYLSIPKLGVQLPVYLGASRENLRKGAAHLSQTSLPIGGADTNAVIAAHRGLASQEMFLHIDQLEEGDEVTLSNFREVLHYRVTDTEIIAPDEMQKVLIQPGRDLLTLVTCHPYPTTRQRYLVYCERVKEPGCEMKAFRSGLFAFLFDSRCALHRQARAVIKLGKVLFLQLPGIARMAEARLHLRPPWAAMPVIAPEHIPCYVHLLDQPVMQIVADFCISFVQNQVFLLIGVLLQIIEFVRGHQVNHQLIPPVKDAAGWAESP